MQIILFTDVADTPGYGKYAGTYKLATELRFAGYTCQVIDHFSWYTFDQLIAILDKFITNETLLVGFSCTLNEKRVAGRVYHWGVDETIFENVVSYIKKKNPKVYTVVGGARITMLSNWSYIDYAIVNKADNALIKLVESLDKNTELKYYQNNHTKTINGDDYFYSQDEFSRSKIVFTGQDIILPNEALPMEIARGCIFSCAYCRFDLIGKKVGDWTKTIDTIQCEITRNYEEFGITHYMFSDELINESISKMELLANAISNLPFKIRYTSFARVDLIWRYPEMRELLLETGAVSLAFGIETFNKRAGQAVGKGMDSEKIKETLHYCNEKWKGKIVTSSNFIVGLPGESEEDIWKTVDYLVSDENPLDVFGFLPLYIRDKEDGRAPSKMDMNPQKFGYILNQGKWQSSTMNFDQASNLVKRIFSDSRVHKRTKFASATWIGRILSLGYTVEEIFSMIHDDRDHSLEIRNRTNNLKKLYYEQLMAL